MAALAHDDPADFGVDGLGDGCVAVGVQPPLQVVAFDHYGAGQFSGVTSLELGPDVHDERAWPARGQRCLDRIQP
jgi:hypothetical protein